MVAPRLLKPLTQFTLLWGLLCVSVVPLDWSSSCYLGCGVNRSAVETCQCDGACSNGRSCLQVIQTPFRRKTLELQRPNCSAWSKLRKPSVAWILRFQERWMLAGELLWLCPWNVLCLCASNLSGVLFVSPGYMGTWQVLMYARVTVCGHKHGPCSAH